MSDEKSLPKIKNNTESNEPPLEYNPNIPMDTIKFRRRISRLNTSMRQIIKRIESRIPKNIGSIFDGKNVKVKSVKLIGLTDKFLNKDVEEKDEYNVFSNEDHLIKNLLNQFKEKNLNKISKKNSNKNIKIIHKENSNYKPQIKKQSPKKENNKNDEELKQSFEEIDLILKKYRNKAINSGKMKKPITINDKRKNMINSLNI